MRLARFRRDDEVRIGVVGDGDVRALPAGTDILEVLCLPLAERDEFVATSAAPAVPLTSVELLAPLDPPAMRDFVVFERHIQGVSKSVSGGAGIPDAWYEAPVFVFMNPHSVLAPFEDLPMPPFTRALDFELEVAAIVGRRVRDVAPDEAARHIVGYAVLNDWSARDIQRREMEVSLGPSKGKDFASTIGPWITTPDELEPSRVGDRLDLTMTVSVNGEVIGSDSLAHMAWSFEDLLVHASRDAWVGAGDVLATGTCGGGALAESWGRRGEQVPPPLKVGDVVSMTVEGLGTIETRIVPTTSPGHRAPEARRMLGA